MRIPPTLPSVAAAVLWAALLCLCGRSEAIEVTSNLLRAKPGEWYRRDSTNRTDLLTVVANEGDDGDSVVTVQMVITLFPGTTRQSISNTIFQVGGSFITKNALDREWKEDTIAVAGKSMQVRVVTRPPQNGYGTKIYISNQVGVTGVVRYEVYTEGDWTTPIETQADSAYGTTRPQGLPDPSAAEQRIDLFLPAVNPRSSKR